MNIDRSHLVFFNPLPDSTTNRIWLSLAIIAVLLVLLFSHLWVTENPLAEQMDESLYVNQVYSDIQAFNERGLQGLGRAILLGDRKRPPGYRIAVLPVTLFWQEAPIYFLRLISLTFLALSCLFLYAAAKQISGHIAGSITAVMLVISPIMITANKNYGSELPLVFAISAMFYFLFRSWERKEDEWYNWVGLGLALGIGAWSKMTFVLLVGPMFILIFILSIRNKIAGPRPSFLIKAVLLGSIISAPWWILNFVQMLKYAMYAAGPTNPRHSLSPTLWDKLSELPGLYAQQALGPAVAIIILLIVSIVLVQYFTQKSGIFNHKQKTALWVCFVGFLPLFILHIIGNNQNMRYIIPPLIPFALAVGITASSSQFFRKPVFILIIASLFGYQVFQIGTSLQADPAMVQSIAEERGYFGRGPSETLAYCENCHWDWDALRNVARSKNINLPSIAHIGNGAALTASHMKYPWIRRGEKVSAKWLWRYEYGSIDWDKINKSIENYNIIVTAPDYIGDPLDKQDLDNVHNFAFAEYMRKHPNFDEPVTIFMGKKTSVKILVFIRKRPAAR